MPVDVRHLDRWSSSPGRDQRARRDSAAASRRPRRPRARGVDGHQRAPLPPGRVRRQRRAGRLAGCHEHRWCGARSARSTSASTLIVLALTMIIVGGSMSWKGAVDRRDHLHLAADLSRSSVSGRTLIYGIIVAVAAVLLPARHLRRVRRPARRAIRAPRREPAARHRRSRGRAASSSRSMTGGRRPMPRTRTARSARPRPRRRERDGMTVDQPQAPPRRRDRAPPARPVLERATSRVHFGGVKAVDGISLRLMPGLIYGIIGPNGSGKTHADRRDHPADPLTRGELLFDGEDYHRRPGVRRLARLRVARTFQTVRLLPDLNVQENIQLGADARTDRGGRPSRSTRPVVAQRVGPRRAAGRRSRGDRADRPGRLRGLLPDRSCPTARSAGSRSPGPWPCDPRLLLLDEPTAGMNQAERAEISALLQRTCAPRGCASSWSSTTCR